MPQGFRPKERFSRTPESGWTLGGFPHMHAWASDSGDQPGCAGNCLRMLHLDMRMQEAVRGGM